MSSNQPSSSGNTGLVTIIVAVITVAGGIAVAYIDSHRGSNEPSRPYVQTPAPTTPAAQTPPPSENPETPLQPVMGALKQDVGLMGGADYDSLHLDNAAECSERCRNESKCVAMTFTSDHTCWLKYQLTQEVSASGMTSAIKTHK